MMAVFECVALAVKEKGVRGLCEAVPGGPYIFDVACHAYKLFRERQKAAALKAELEKVAAASAAEARRVAEEVARKVVNDGPIEERLALELYLTQLPGAARQSLLWAEECTGGTLLTGLPLDSPEGFAQVLPRRAPRFRPGAELPGRPGWRLEELLGAGGFGEVWLARHALLPQPRAVKFCTDEKLKARLTSHEGRVIARVMQHGHHPNVVPLLDALLDGEAPWLMYEFVGGGSLTELIHRWRSLQRRDRESLAVAALAQLAGAVAAFHRLAPPIVHRDLKPANILVGNAECGMRNAEFKTEDLRPPALKITDFGIGGVASGPARDGSLLFADTFSSLRGSHSPHYASPQQARGDTPDPRDDTHALGVIAYQMLTGSLTEAPRPRFERDLLARGFSAKLIELIGDCVDTDPGARPKDGGELAERLAALPSPSPRWGEGNARSPLEGGAAPVTILPVATSAEPEKWRIPLRGTWYAREVAAPVPGDVFVQPGESYRLAISPDSTDVELAKLRSLAGLPGLEAIDLSGCVYVTDAGLMHLAHLRGLKSLGLAETRVTDSGVALLATRFPDLEALDLLATPNLTTAVVSHLLRMRKLARLALPPRADTPEARAEFANRRPNCELV